MSRIRSPWGLFALATAALLLSSCVTAGNREFRAGERDYDAGNFAGAVNNAVQALQVNRDHEEALSLLRRALPRATEQLEGHIAQLRGSSESFAWEEIVPAYQQLVRLHGEVAALTIGVATENYETRLQEARDNAAEARYDAGTAALAAGGFENARQALDHFRRIDTFALDFRDTDALITRAADASRARLYVYVNGADAALAQGIADQLMYQDSLTEITEMVPPGSLNLGSGRDSSAVLSAAASQGVDLILYVSLGAVTEEKQPLQATEKQLIGGARGFEKTASFTVAQDGRWQIFDVAGRAVRSEDTFRVAVAETLKYEYLPGSGETVELSFLDVGSREVEYVAMQTLGLLDVGRYSRAISQTVSFVNSNNPEGVGNAGFNELTEKLNGVILYPGVYAFKVGEAGGLLGSDGEERSFWERLDPMLQKMAALHSAIEANAGNLDTHVLRARGNLPGGAIATVVRATAAPLSQ
jgi:tetratricopeptide (TPR) repeat protein